MKNIFHSVVATSVLFAFSLSGFSQEHTLRTKNLPTPQHLGPSCQFSTLNYCFGDTTYFINQTIRMMNPSWEITDSSGAVVFSSLDTNIKFLFPSMETYNVKLRADNGHPDSITKSIVIDSITKADFVFQQCSQRFINMSSCATNFYWDFGDGNFSLNPTPTHPYADTGLYNVTLIAYKGAISDTITQNIYVYSKGFPTGTFTYFQSNDTVYFFGDSVGDNFNWDFGDQTTSNLKNPAHVFPDTGDYNVLLIVNNYCDVKLQYQLIHVFSTSGVFSYDEENIPILFYPNPFHDVTAMKIIDSRFRDFHIRITDIFGREVFTETINNSDSFIIRRRGMPSGIYFIRAMSGDKNIGYSKLIIQ